MEVRPGYKRTEVGPLPEEWSLKGLGEIASLDVGLSKPGIVFGSGCPVVTVQDLYSGATINVAGLKRVVVTNEEVQKYRLATDDILIGNASVKRDGIGYANKFDGAAEDVIFAKYAYRASNLRTILPLFLHHVLRADFCRHWIVANSQTGTLTNLNKAAARAIPIPVPKLIGEQRAIAAALSDVDALLAGLDRLIAKKRDLKQAAMQQLLTGQTRLRGFQGKWEVKRLEEVFRISVGTSKSAFAVENGDFWICDMGSVSTTGKLIVSKRTNYRGDFLETGDLIMPKDDIGGGKIIGKVGYIDADDTYVLSDHVYHLRATEGNSLFLAYVINSHRTNRELRKKVIGSAQLGLGRKSVTEQEIQFPPVEEQGAIATVLSDMDAELTVLEARRDKTRALKQAMMQELLTGRTRLVRLEDEEAAAC